MVSVETVQLSRNYRNPSLVIAKASPHLILVVQDLPGPIHNVRAQAESLTLDVAGIIELCGHDFFSV